MRGPWFAWSGSCWLAASEDLVGARAIGSGRLHLLERPLRVSRLHVDSPDGVVDHGDGKTCPERVEDALLDAVVGGQAGDEEAVDPAVAQEISERRVLESRINPGVWVLA